MIPSDSHVAVIRLLLDAGASPCVKDVGGYTPLHHCTLGTSSQLQLREIFPLLISAGGDVNAGNRARRTPLVEPALTRRDDAVKLLIRAGADPTIADTSGIPPIALSELLITPTCRSLFTEYVRETHKSRPRHIDAAEGALTGRKVTLHGLASRPELNGQTCLAGRFIAESGRYEVALESGETFRIKAVNLLFEDEKVCAVCSEPAAKSCGACFRVYYCSTACQTAGWKTHRPLCTAAQGRVVVVPESDTYEACLGVPSGGVMWSVYGSARDEGAAARQPPENAKFRVKVQVPLAMLYKDDLDSLGRSNTSFAPGEKGLLLLYNKDKSVHLAVKPCNPGYDSLVSTVIKHGVVRPRRTRHFSAALTSIWRQGKAKAYFNATRKGGSLHIMISDVLPCQPW